MAGKHTPGPWRILIDGTCSGAWPFIGPAHLPDDELCDEAVAELGTTHTERRRIMRRGVPGTFAEKPARFEPTPDHDTIMANARLIAAAPELVEFAEYVRALAFDFVNEGIRPHEHHMRDLAWKADKIVSKATRATQPLPPPNEE